jgi:hypothetical protein
MMFANPIFVVGKNGKAARDTMMSKYDKIRLRETKSAIRVIFLMAA